MREVVDTLQDAGELRRFTDLFAHAHHRARRRGADADHRSPGGIGIVETVPQIIMNVLDQALRSRTPSKRRAWPAWKASASSPRTGCPRKPWKP